MSNNQNHGVEFQFKLAPEFGKGNRTGPVDFDCDPVSGFPVHFKSKHNNTRSIAMSSLTAFVKLLSQPEPFDLVVLSYNQDIEEKVAKRLNLYHFDPGLCRKDILGDFILDDAIRLQQSISRNSILDNHEARLFAKHECKNLKPKLGKLILNHKIGNSDPQRRMQCSLHESDLQNAMYGHEEFTTTFRSTDISSLRVISGQRQRNAKRCKV